MIQGLRTVVYPAPDLDRGKAWYTALLGYPPYFDEPFYVGFEVGGFELGLIPDGQPGQGGATSYWGVANIEESIAKLLELGAKIKDPVEDVGSNIKAASILDPFGNVVGIIQNPHFDRTKVR